ncbi:MAG: hypothetical protein ABEJ83_03105 [Candidatus Nanohaloarchaea archaeon]
MTEKKRQKQNQINQANPPKASRLTAFLIIAVSTTLLTIAAGSPPSIPTNIDCDNGICQKTVSNNVTLEASGATDPENDPITYHLETSLEKNSTYTNNTEISKTVHLNEREVTESFHAREAVLDQGNAVNLQGMLGKDDSTKADTGNDNGNAAQVDAAHATGFIPSSISGSNIKSVRIRYRYSVGEIRDWEGAYRFRHSTGSGYTEDISGSTPYGQTSIPLTTSKWFNITSEYSSLSWNSLNNTKLQAMYDESSWSAEGHVYLHWAEMEVKYDAPQPVENKETSYTYYNFTESDYTRIDEAKLNATINEYSSLGSGTETAPPSIKIEAWNGVDWQKLGNLSLPQKYGENIRSTDQKTSKLKINNSGILDAWKNAENQKIRLKGVNFDGDVGGIDRINISQLKLNIDGEKWVSAGSHSEGGDITWNVQNLEEQECVQLRAKASDGTSESGYYSEGSCLDIGRKPEIQNPQLNTTEINHTETVKLNVTVNDENTVKNVNTTVKYPNGTKKSFKLEKTTESGYRLAFDDTLQTGIYNITQIAATDQYNNTRVEDPALSFNVTKSPPQQFSLMVPSNQTVSQDVTPTIVWTETVEPHFKNYTILFDQQKSFPTPQRFKTTSISDTDKEITQLLKENQQYFWKITAYDRFGAKTSTPTYRYTTDNAAPDLSIQSPENNSYFTKTSITFNYTVNDPHLQSCTLYTNFSGSYEQEMIEGTVTNGENSFQQTAPEGNYVWNIQCEDTAGNTFKPQKNYSTGVDLSKPSVQIYGPPNESFYANTNNIDFYGTASDKISKVDTCSLYLDGQKRDTKQVTGQSSFQFTSLVQDGNHTWSFSCQDINGYTNTSKTYHLDVQADDEDPPLVELNSPVNKYLSQRNVEFNYTPSDATGIQSCSLRLNGTQNQTDNNVQNLEPNTFQTTVPEGKTSWSVSCTDNSTQTNTGNSTTANFTVDTTKPRISLETPRDEASLSSSQLNFQYTPQDRNLDTCSLYGNFSGSFTQSETDQQPRTHQTNSFTKTVQDGVYTWNIQCQDLSGNKAFNDKNYTIKVDTQPPYWTQKSEKPVSPVTYRSGRRYSFNATWKDNYNVETVKFESNFTGNMENTSITSLTDTYSFSVQDLPAGTYRYRWHAEDNEGNQNSTSWKTYTVEKRQAQLNLLINGSSTSYSMNEDNKINITAEAEVPDQGTIQLYLDSREIASGTAHLEQIREIKTPGNYEVKAKIPGNRNYTSASKTLQLQVNDTTPPSIQVTAPENRSIVSLEPTISYEVSDASGIDRCSLYLNGSITEIDNTVLKTNTQSFTPSLSRDQYNFNIKCSDAAGNKNTTLQYSVTAREITKIVSNTNISRESYKYGEKVKTVLRTRDKYGNHRDASVETSLIQGNTSKPWWNTEWRNRKPVTINKPESSNTSNLVTRVNITGLNNQIDTCREIRIVKTVNASTTEVPSQIDSGNNATWCQASFLVDTNKGTTKDTRFMAYYDNPSAAKPGYSLNIPETHVFYAGDAVKDTGVVSDLNALIGRDDTNATAIGNSQGGSPIDGAAHGQNFVSNFDTGKIQGAWIRYRYSVTNFAGWEANYMLRHSTGNGYTTDIQGSSNVQKTSSPWINITNEYPELTWNNIDQTKLQGYYDETGYGEDGFVNLFWTAVNVSYPENTNTETGKTQTLKTTKTVVTDTQKTNLTFDTRKYSPGNYSTVSVASSPRFKSSTSHDTFKITEDTQPPIITNTDTVPKASGYTQNGKTYVLQQKGAELQLEAEDNVRLKEATLATNETGSWQNKTSYSSPKNLDATEPLNISFNWKNKSISEGTTVAWRVWVKDSSANTNVTKTGEFEVVKGNDLKVNLTQETGETLKDSNVTIKANGKTIYNYKISQQKSIQLPQNRNYSITTEAQVGSKKAAFTLYNFSTQQTTNIQQQLVQNYNAKNLENVETIETVYALNETGLNFGKAQLKLPKMGISPNIILHCTDWNYTTRKCSNWQKNKTSAYPHRENSTHFTFNVTKFDAYGLSEGTPVPNITDIEIYNVTDLSQQKQETGGTLIASGLNKTYNIRQQKENAEYRLEFQIRNDGDTAWQIQSEDILKHSGLNKTWNVEKIWYNISGIIREGGTLQNKNITWNTSLGGELTTGSTMTARYIVNTTVNIKQQLDLKFRVEDSSQNSGSTDQHKLNISKTGFIDIKINEPPENTVVPKGEVFTANATIQCREGVCGETNATIRYNETGEADTLIPEGSGTPFHLNETNLKTCGALTSENCTKTWQVNATADLGTEHLIDVNTSSTRAKPSDSPDRKITVNQAMMIDLGFNKVSFGTLAPGQQNKSAKGNNQSLYNITVPENSVTVDRLYIRGTNLTTGGWGNYTIPAQNISYAKQNSLNQENTLLNSYSRLASNIPSGTNVTTYYWIDIPEGLKSANYQGKLYFKANETQ